jgi:hypothetical protein
MMCYTVHLQTTLLAFEKRLGEHVNLETKEQAHWYLATQITQLACFDIILDHTRYCKSVLKKYFESVGSKHITTKHTIPLPATFASISEDCLESEEKSAELAEEYKLDYASCIGSLIYLSQTCSDILFAVSKLARYMRTRNSTF